MEGTQDTTAQPGAEGVSSTGAAQPANIKEALMGAAAPAALEAGAENPVKDAMKTAEGETPEWAKDIPEHLRGETAEETLGKVNVAYAGARKTLSEKGTAKDLPADAESYKFDLGEGYTKLFGEGGDDPMLKSFAAAAHEQGIGQEAAQKLLSGIVDKAIEGGMFEKPMSMDEFYQGMGGEETGGKVFGDIKAWLGNVESSGGFGDTGTAEGKAAAAALKEAAFEMAATSPQAALALDALRKSNAAPGMKLPGTGDRETGLELTIENARARQADPRNDTQSPQYDPAFRKMTSQMFAELDKQK